MIWYKQSSSRLQTRNKLQSFFSGERTGRNWKDMASVSDLFVVFILIKTCYHAGSVGGVYF